MFDGPTIEDMKVQPDLGEGETVVATVGAKLGDVLRDNVVVTVTTSRLLVREKRGRDVDDEDSDRCGLEIPLEDIDVVRRTGILTKEIEVVCDDEVHKLPPLQNNSDEIIDPLTDQEQLDKTDWGEESKAKRGTKQLLAGITGIVGFVIGGLLVLAGIGLIISIVGILMGIGFLFIGGLMIVGSWRLIEWAFGKEEEWVQESPAPAV